MTTLIQISGLHKHYGSTAIFDDAEVAIADDEKIGVIGRNGAGKSTLCRIILGEEEADAGQVSLHDDLRLSYLEQKDPFLPDETVLGFLMRYSSQEDWRCGKLAGRFLLDQPLLERTVSSLSGGFQTRVKLCAMLLREPNFLILDEPTNYLDLKTLLLLEDFLRGFAGGFMIVSHDREFLKKTCTHTIEVEHGKISTYPGDVEAWLAYKRGQREQAEHHNAGVAIRRKQLQTFVDKNRAKASKASQAQSKMKLLERLEDQAVAVDAASVTITMPSVEDRKGTALRCIDLAIGYPGRTIAAGIDLEIERGKHVAVLGDNGQGKTTFLSTLAAGIPAKGGEVRWGFGLRLGYYAQHVYAAIDPRSTVLRYLERAASAGDGPTVPTQKILDMAGCFLFRGDDVNKPVSVLSGGERSRLCLAGLLLGRYPVLLLDEPTNHLDFETVEALASALTTYNGTIFFTSHDRTFVSMIATSIIEVAEGSVALYHGDYATYVYRLEKEVRGGGAAAGAPRAGEPARPPGTASTRRETPRLQECRKRLRVLDKEIATREAERQSLMARASGQAASWTAEDSRRLADCSARLEAAEAEWLTLQEESERLGGPAKA